MATYFKVECFIQCPSDWTRQKAVLMVEEHLLSSQQEKDVLLVTQITEKEFSDAYHNQT